MPRHPKPQALIDYLETIARGVPRVCWSCLHYDQGGRCDLYGSQPPADFAAEDGACGDWIDELPF